MKQGLGQLTIQHNIIMGPTLLENKCMFAFLWALISSFLILDCYLLLLIQNSSGPPPLHLNNTFPGCTIVSPFCTIDVKSLLLDWMNFYVWSPMSAVIYKVGHFSTALSFVSANSISFSHVVLALVAGKLVAHDSLCVRRVGVLLFEARNLLDALDGTVARAQKARNPESDGSSSNMGYYVDGICDGIGCIFLLIGCTVYLRNHPIKKNVFYAPLPATIISWTDQKEKELGNSGSFFLARVVLCVRNKVHISSNLPVWIGIQWFTSSVGWNRYIAGFTHILQRPNVTETVRASQGDFFRQPFTCFTFMLWRLINVHAASELLLFSIFFDKMGDMLILMHFFGWLLLFCAVISGETLLRAAQYLF